MTVQDLKLGLRKLHPVALAVLSIIVMCTATASTPTFYAGPQRSADAAFFGMHIHRAASGTPWPGVPFGGWRLWDAGVSWPELEPARGTWDFTLLDRYVAIAAEKRVEILLTLGLTPRWASARPDEASSYGPGKAAPAVNIVDWKEYVRTVATRYKGVIHNYEIWNEPNVKGSFSGSAKEMLPLAQAAFQILKSVDPTIVVVSPSATTVTGLRWLEDYLRHGGCAYSDVIGYHFYVTPAPPEAIIPVVRQAQHLLAEYRCPKPIWNTESGWAKPKHFASDEEAAGYVMRSLLLNWLLGIQRCYWYAWDNHNWSTLDLTSPSEDLMSRTGAAYGVAYNWMHGAVLRSCRRLDSGTWICELDRENATSRILWSDTGDQPYNPPNSWHVRAIFTWTGLTQKSGAPITIGSAPLLLTGN